MDEGDEEFDTRLRWMSEVRKSLYQHGFEIIRPIGDGGFATVYQVKSRQYNEDFVVKLIDLSTDDSNVLPSSFETEIDILSKLCHPNVIQFYNHFTSKSCLYIILEYCPGGSLKDVITKVGFIRPPLLYELCRQIMEALAYCHEKGVAHRDVKPANILIDKYGRAKLADFGIAQHFPKTQLSQMFGGSLVYLSPEVLKKKPFDPMMADIWSLGVTFFEMASGNLPWEGDTPQALEKAIFSQKVNIPDHFSKEFIHILGKMLNTNPQNRMSLSDIENCSIFRKETTVNTRSMSKENYSSSPGRKMQPLKQSIMLAPKTASSRFCCFSKRRMSSFIQKKTFEDDADDVADSYENA